MFNKLNAKIEFFSLITLYLLVYHNQHLFDEVSFFQIFYHTKLLFFSAAGLDFFCLVFQ